MALRLAWALILLALVFLATNHSGPVLAETLQQSRGTPVFTSEPSPITSPVVSIWNSSLSTANIADPGMVPGSTVGIQVNVTGAPPFDTYYFTLEYHSGMVQFLDYTLANTVFWPNLNPSIYPGLGTVYVDIRSANQRTVSGNGVLFYARFQVLNTGLSPFSVKNPVLSCQSCGGSYVYPQTRGGCFNNHAPKIPAIDFSTPPTPGYYETSEYMIGRVAVGIILPESTGPHYNWTDAEVAQTINGIRNGLAWWASQEPSAMLSFVYEEHVRVPTSYEPIEMSISQDTLWIGEVMNFLGYGSEAFSATRSFNNALRQRYETDWAYTIFVVDSNPNVNQGLFAGGGYAWAYFGGPWVTMSRYSTWAYNYIEYFTAVPAHETGHIFWATDEYDGYPQNGGYLWTPDADFSYGIMNQNDLNLAPSTRAQVGLVDCDADGIIDLLDTKPALQHDEPGTIPTQTATRINGKALVVPHPSYRPGGRDITIGTISRVEFNVDAGPAQFAVAVDGAFDEALEDYYFDVSFSNVGQHAISLAVVNSVGATERTTFLVNVVLLGDVNGDCVVNIFDFSRVGSQIGTTSDMPGFDVEADLNNDGVINIFDFAGVGSNIGAVC